MNVISKAISCCSPRFFSGATSSELNLEESNQRTAEMAPDPSLETQKNDQSADIELLMKQLQHLFQHAGRLDRKLSSDASRRLVQNMGNQLVEIGEKVKATQYKETWQALNFNVQKPQGNAIVSLIEEVLDYPLSLVGASFAAGASILLAMGFTATWSLIAPGVMMLGLGFFLIQIDRVIHSNPHGQLQLIADQFNEFVVQLTKELADAAFKSMTQAFIASAKLYCEDERKTSPTKAWEVKNFESIEAKFNRQEDLQWYDLVGLAEKTVTTTPKNERNIPFTMSLSFWKILKTVAGTNKAHQDLLFKLGTEYLTPWSKGEEVATLNQKWKDFIQSYQS